jgi:lysyl-tRNA synthetase class 1
LSELAAAAKAWPFAEARALADRLRAQHPQGGLPAKGHVLLETGYGPSGLPHIGTFAEVARTTMVRRAFEALSGLPTRLVVFSDDLDGLRKVPDNLPQREMLAAHLGRPLTRVPDPFGTHASLGEHNNARLRAFLDGFGFDYEFKSAAQCYTSGEFDAVLLDVLRHYDRVAEIVRPTLGEERRATYSPFLPICPATGRVLEAPVVGRDVNAGTITFRDEQGRQVTVPVTGGHCKLQWKVDWAMRWRALDVDYEMAGKDLSESVKLSSRIVQTLGGTPPAGFSYELFLDERGEKISKSRGNGLTIEEWLRYAPPESLSYFMYLKPRTAKRLFFDVIPKAVDEYLDWLARFPGQEPLERLDNPVWHVHGGAPPAAWSPVGFGMLLNLVAAAHAEDKATLWQYLRRYGAEATPEQTRQLDQLVGHAIHYYDDFVKPTRRHRPPDAREREALRDLRDRLAGLDASAAAEEIQTLVYEVGKDHGFTELRAWFRSLYNVLLGQETGPRMGSFISLYGIAETRRLIDQALERGDRA